MRSIVFILLFLQLHTPTAEMIDRKYSVMIEKAVAKHPYINKEGKRINERYSFGEPALCSRFVPIEEFYKTKK